MGRHNHAYLTHLKLAPSGMSMEDVQCCWGISSVLWGDTISMMIKINFFKVDLVSYRLINYLILLFKLTNSSYCAGYLVPMVSLHSTDGILYSTDHSLMF